VKLEQVQSLLVFTRLTQLLDRLKRDHQL